MTVPNSHRNIEAIPKGASPRHGDMLVGYVFPYHAFPDWTSDHQLGGQWVRTIPVMPIAGPIFYQEFPDQPWARYSAMCAGCNAHSKHYAKRTSRIRTWALMHRCKDRVELLGLVWRPS